MSGGDRRRNRRGRRGDEHEEGGAGMERWLLTYADMITLLLALFIVLWSISSVNISKFQELRASLSQALNGKVIEGSSALLNGGQAPLNPQGTQTPRIQPAVPSPSSISASIVSQIVAGLKKRDTENLQRVQRQVRTYAAEHGLEGTLHTSIDERGLVIRVLTDQLLFDPGQATLKPAAAPLLDHLARLLTADNLTNPVRVEGNTDSVPISTPQFHSNWELSTARATAVLQFLLAHGVQAHRLSAVGYADQKPIASNLTAAGRSRNRRVDLVVLRKQPTVKAPTATRKVTP